MKISATILLIVMFAGLFTGCKKCITCTEKRTGYTTDFCGTSKEVKDFENELKSQGSAAGQDWSCIDKSN